MQNLKIFIGVLIVTAFFSDPCCHGWTTTPRRAIIRGPITRRSLVPGTLLPPLTTRIDQRIKANPTTTTARWAHNPRKSRPGGGPTTSTTEKSKLRLRNLLLRLRSGGSQNDDHDSDGSVQNGAVVPFVWTARTIVRALLVFVGSGLAEIGGGWLVWKAVRENKPWWWALIGSFTLVGYGFLPTLQPTDSFGRVYAVYGGFFIALSYVWGYFFDGLRLDAGDVIGGSLALLAVLVILFWPRAQ